LGFGFRECRVSIFQPVYFHVAASCLVGLILPHTVTKGIPHRKRFCAFCAFLWLLKGDSLLGPELEFAVFVDLGFGLQTTRNFDYVLKDALADFVDRFCSVDHSAG
jgi:hypothetical protein